MRTGRDPEVDVLSPVGADEQIAIDTAPRIARGDGRGLERRRAYGTLDRRRRHDRAGRGRGEHGGQHDDPARGHGVLQIQVGYVSGWIDRGAHHRRRGFDAHMARETPPMRYQESTWPPRGGGPERGRVAALFDGPYIIGFRPLGTLAHLEFHALAFLKRPKALGLNGALMDKDICPTVILLDESKALRVIEPLYFSSRHLTQPLNRARVAVNVTTSRTVRYCGEHHNRGGAKKTMDL